MNSEYKPSEYQKINLKSLELINHFVQKWMKHNYSKEFNSNLHAIPIFVWTDLMCELEGVYEMKWAEKADEEIND